LTSTEVSCHLTLSLKRLLTVLLVTAVAERTFLFLSERRQQYGKGELKHDAEWIQTHLQVFEVR
jgi:hypothetical protein